MVGVGVTTLLEQSHNDNTLYRKNFIPRYSYCEIPTEYIDAELWYCKFGRNGSFHWCKVDLVKNNGAEFTCNISTGLGIIVDINIIVLIRSSYNVEPPNFSDAVQSKGSPLRRWRFGIV